MSLPSFIFGFRIKIIPSHFGQLKFIIPDAGHFGLQNYGDHFGILHVYILFQNFPSSLSILIFIYVPLSRF